MSSPIPETSERNGEEGDCFVRFVLLLGPRRAKKARAAPPLFEPVGKGRAQAETVGVARVDSAEQRLQDDVDHLAAEAALEELADRDVAAGIDGPLHDLAQARSLPDMERSGERKKGRMREGMPSTSPSGMRCQLAAPQNVDAAIIGDRFDEARPEAELFAEVKRLRARHDERVGARFDDEAVLLLGVDVAAETRSDASRSVSRSGAPFAIRLADHGVRRGEPRKSPADHDYPHRAAGHVSPNRAGTDSAPVDWCTKSTRRATLSTGVSGRMPWPRLKM